MMYCSKCGAPAQGGPVFMAGGMQCQCGSQIFHGVVNFPIPTEVETPAFRGGFIPDPAYELAIRVDTLETQLQKTLTALKEVLEMQSKILATMETQNTVVNHTFLTIEQARAAVGEDIKLGRGPITAALDKRISGLPRRG